MKMYVWEGKDVLQDYGTGIIVALAENLDEAYKVIKRDDGIAKCGRDFPECPTTVIDLDKPYGAQAYTCWGGG